MMLIGPGAESSGKDVDNAFAILRLLPDPQYSERLEALIKQADAASEQAAVATAALAKADAVKAEADQAKVEAQKLRDEANELKVQAVAAQEAAAQLLGADRANLAKMVADFMAQKAADEKALSDKATSQDTDWRVAKDVFAREVADSRSQLKNRSDELDNYADAIASQATINTRQKSDNDARAALLDKAEANLAQRFAKLKELASQ